MYLLGVQAQYIHFDSKLKLFSNLLKQIKFSYGPFWQSNIYSTLKVFPRPARKEIDVHRKCLQGIAVYHYKVEANILLSKYINCAYK